METSTIVAIAAGLGGLCMSGIGIVTFWMNFATKIANNKSSAEAALNLAQEAKKDAHEASEKIVLLSASFGIYREQVAREYIHREVMREVEDRLTAAIERLGDRLDRVLEKQQPRSGSH
jgi:uncharacterized coiled-coil DUF342 family protein